jgi:hypothetical protein
MGAHHAAAQSWDLRLYGGMSNSEFYGGSKLFGDQSKNGFALGVGGEYIRYDTDPVGWEFGLWYVQKGAKGSIEYNPWDPEQDLPPDTNFQGEIDLAYLQLNFLMVGHLYTSKTTEVRLYLGPTLGNRLSAKVKGTLNGDPVDEDIKDYIKTFEWGIIAGAGFNYKMGGWSIIADLTSFLGANSIAEDTLDSDLKTRTFVATLGVELPLARW